MPGPIDGIAEVALWVDDVERSLEFYRDTLGLEVADYDPGHHAFLKAGPSLLVIFSRTEPNTVLAREYLARTGGPRGDVYHIALRMPTDALDLMAETLRSGGKAVKGPVEFAGGRRSYFLDDPDEHYLELTDV